MRDILNTPILFLIFVTLAVIGIQWGLFMLARKANNKPIETFIAGPGGRVAASS